MQIRRAGDRALLVERDGLDEVTALHAALRAHPPAGVIDLVPAARTLLVQFDPAVAGDIAHAVRQAAETPAAVAPEQTDELVEIPVTYDGEDLDDVAAFTDLSRREIVAAHTATVQRVAFCGFAPGFGYLAGGDPRLHVPRRETSRTRVPAGAVGLAGEFSGIYPRASPGGWQLIGHTDLVTFDLHREPAALLRPGVRVQFVERG